MTIFLLHINCRVGITDLKLQLRHSHHRPWLLWSELWTGLNSSSHWPMSFDSHRDALTPAQRGRGLNYQHGRAKSACSQDCLCLQNELVCDLVFHSCFPLVGLCPPLEKCLLRLRAHSSTWILLHHSSHPSEQDETTHTLLWRYSKDTMVDKHSAYFARIVLDFCPYVLYFLH